MQGQQDAASGLDDGALQRQAALGVSGAGEALPHRSRIESAFGRDLSHVRAHVGGAAAESAGAIGAEAYATANNVAFSRAPSLHTAAHEAAHVVQQAEGVSLLGGVGRAGDTYERNADAVADRVVAGQSAADLLPGRLSSGSDGNQALQRTPSSVSVQLQAAPAPAPPPPATAVSNRIVDGPYAWQSRYDVTLSSGECRVVLKPKLVPDAGVPAADVEAVKQRAAAAFTRLFDNKFILTDAASGAQYTLRTAVQFVDSGEHYTIALHAGANRSNRTEWSVGRPDETFAHELGHTLGLKDEYIDAAVPDRAAATSPGVHTDHSIMGNYHAEGRADARMQQRHAETIGSAVGSATGHGFTVSRRP